LLVKFAGQNEHQYHYDKKQPKNTFISGKANCCSLILMKPCFVFVLFKSGIIFQEFLDMLWTTIC